MKIKFLLLGCAVLCSYQLLCPPKRYSKESNLHLQRPQERTVSDPDRRAIKVGAQGDVPLPLLDLPKAPGVFSAVSSPCIKAPRGPRGEDFSSAQRPN